MIPSKNNGTKSCVFIGALLIIAKTQKQPKCPRADECIKNCDMVTTMISYNVILFCFIFHFFKVGSKPLMKPNVGPELTILRSRPKLNSRVRHLTEPHRCSYIPF